MNRFAKTTGALLAISVFLTFKVDAAEANKPKQKGDITDSFCLALKYQ